MERLQAAIEKARAARLERGEDTARTRVTQLAPSPQARSRLAWSELETIELSDAHLAEQRIVTGRKSDPAHLAFDVLRTRLSRKMAEQGWRRVMVTSPREGCGKTTVAANLAMSLARNSDWRTLLLDLDLRNPQLAARLGCRRAAAPLETWLTSGEPPRSHFRRLGDNLAVGLNARPVQNAAELLHDARTVQRLASTIALLDPAAVVYDMPAMLVTDDTIGFLGHVDCVLLVASAGQTTADEIEECERLLMGSANFLGVLLNKCEGPSRWPVPAAAEDPAPPSAQPAPRRGREDPRAA